MADRYSFPCNPATNPKAIVTGSTRRAGFRFSILTDRLLRYEWSADGGFEDRVSTFALFRWFDAPKYQVVDKKDRLEITTDHFHLTYDKREFSSSGLSVQVANDVWRYDGKSYGDLGGTARTLDGAWGRVDLEPGVLSRKSYATLDDSKSMLFEDGWIATRRPGRIDGYLFAYNGDHKAAIKDFYRLSGNQPILPRWTLGNWWSRYHEYSADEYIELVDHFKREGIPLNVGVIDMDWHKVKIPSKYGSGWTGYSWNRDLFPEPEGFMEDLRRRGLKVTLNDHPADGIRAFEDQYKAVAKALKHDTSREEPIRFDSCDRQFLDAYFDVLKLDLEKQGVDFWWIDWQQGTRSKIPGVDPLWVLNHYHYLTSRRNVKTLDRPLTFSRYAGAGSHRYPIGFSGDTQITWAGLEFQPEFTATASNIGYGWWSHDIGGHWAGVRSNQLTVRWVQLGCFSPILRLHSTKNLWNSKEPWNFEKGASTVIKNFLNLRHRLIPFLYTMNIRASYENEPLVQPMYWNHKEDEAYTVPTQYYFGPDLIVAPITSPDSSTTLMGGVRAWLPAGRFIDLFDARLVYDGNRYMRLHRGLSRMPVLAREGTILPLDSTPKLANGSPRPTEMTILLVVGADAHFELVEEPESPPPADDNGNGGRGAQPPLSSFVRTPITWRQRDGLLTIGAEWNGAGRWRQWNVKLVGHSGAADVQAMVPGFRVTRDDDERSTTVALGNVHRWSPEGFEIALGRDLQLDVVDVKQRVFEVVHRCEMWYGDKDPVWEAVAREGDAVETRVERLSRLNVDAALKNAVMEIWAADGRAPGTAKGHEVWAEVAAGEAEEVEEALRDYVLV
ncbi:glycoside hydrolase family 31 protein [Trichocladium antarcticum]|uniref:alpha-glucosidase n=1 Tax=Trichocladium antarcticum TaxID=1450529 RepID=A0AAN6UBL8_9PEZI|nr:glycoside hydrolase family 31 protein [Trichocladium antarcticum]